MNTGNDSKLLDEFLTSKREGKVKHLEVKDYVNLLDYVYSIGDDKIYIPEMLESAEKLYPNDYSIKHWKINYLLDEDRAKEALEYMESLPVDNYNENYILDLASCYIKLKMYSRIYDKCKELDSLNCNTLLKFADYIILNLLPYVDDKDVLEITSKISEFSSHVWGMDEVGSLDQDDDLTIDGHCAFGQYNKAIEYADIVLKEDPYNAFIWMRLGDTYMEIEEYEKAIEAFDFALAIAYKKNKGTYIIQDCMIHKAEALMYKGSYIKSIEVLKDLLEDEKAKTYLENTIYECMGICYYNLKEYDKSYEYFSKEYELEPEDTLMEHIVEYFVSCIHTQHLQQAKDLMSEYKTLKSKHKNDNNKLNKILKDLNIGRSDAECTEDVLFSYDLINNFLFDKNNRN